MLLYPGMPYSDVVRENPSLIPILSRFGIGLGMGDRSIGEVAALHGTDPDFLLTLLNTCLNESYFPEKTQRVRSVPDRPLFDRNQRILAAVPDPQYGKTPFCLYLGGRRKK